MEMNHRRATSMGIPLVRVLVDPLNLGWIVIEPFLWHLLDLLPIDRGTFGLYSRRGWHSKDKAASHVKYGPAWALVTLRDTWVHIAEPDAIHDIFLRRGDFLRPSKMYSKPGASPSLHYRRASFSKPLILPQATELLEVYGPCISTAS